MIFRSLAKFFSIMLEKICKVPGKHLNKRFSQKYDYGENNGLYRVDTVEFGIPNEILLVFLFKSEKLKFGASFVSIFVQKE